MKKQSTQKLTSDHVHHVPVVSEKSQHFAYGVFVAVLIISSISMLQEAFVTENELDLPSFTASVYNFFSQYFVLTDFHFICIKFFVILVQHLGVIAVATMFTSMHYMHKNMEYTLLERTRILHYTVLRFVYYNYLAFFFSLLMAFYLVNYSLMVMVTTFISLLIYAYFCSNLSSVANIGVYFKTKKLWSFSAIMLFTNSAGRLDLLKIIALVLAFKFLIKAFDIDTNIYAYFSIIFFIFLYGLIIFDIRLFKQKVSNVEFDENYLNLL